MRGRWALEAYGGVSEMDVWTSPPLHVNRACTAPHTPGFDRGTLRTLDDSGVAMRIDLAGCGDWGSTYEKPTE